MLMSLNSHEFLQIEAMAKAYGAKFRSDAALFPRLDGDRSPLSLRIPVRRGMPAGSVRTRNFCRWKEFFLKEQGNEIDRETLQLRCWRYDLPHRRGGPFDAVHDGEGFQI